MFEQYNDLVTVEELCEMNNLVLVEPPVRRK